MHSVDIRFQNVHYILELATEDFEFHGSLALVGNILQCLFCLINLHILHIWILVPGFEGFHVDTPVVISDFGIDVGVCMRRL